MLIPFPASPVPAKVEWAIDQPGQANRGEFTGKRRVTLLSAAPRWYAKVTLPPIRGEERVLDWRAYVVDCDGIANHFRLIACERPQITGVAVTVKGGGQGGHSLVTQGWGAAGLKLRRGQFVTVDDQLLMVQAPVVADDAGVAIVQFKPYIRYVPADGAAIEVTRPYGVMSMSDPRNGWAADIGQSYAIGFDCEEAF
jgi:hypothetical protein